MTSSDLAILGILPAVLWASVAFVSRSTTPFATKLRKSMIAKTKEELAEGSLSWAYFVVLLFVTVLGLVIAWSHVHAWHTFQSISNFDGWEQPALHGFVLGFTLLGFLILFRNFFPKARRFGMLSMAGAASPFWSRIALPVLVILTEELWRAVCLRALTADGFSGPQSVIITSAVYGTAYLLWGSSVAIFDGAMGVVYGGLFIWSGSILVPLVMRVIVQGRDLIYAIAAPPDAQPGDMHRKPFAKCPACQAALNLKQVNLNVNEAFFCPSCHTRITSSDKRRLFYRWGILIVAIGFWIVSWDMLPDALNGSSTQYGLSIAVEFLAGLGMYSVLQVLVPPRFVCGDPDFIGLNLGDGNRPLPEKEKDSVPIEPDNK